MKSLECGCYEMDGKAIRESIRKYNREHPMEQIFAHEASNLHNVKACLTAQKVKSA